MKRVLFLCIAWALSFITYRSNAQSLDAISPAGGYTGQTITFFIDGIGTDFTTSLPEVYFVNSTDPTDTLFTSNIQVLSTVQLSGDLVLACNVSGAPYDVYVRQGASFYSLLGGFIPDTLGVFLSPSDPSCASVCDGFITSSVMGGSGTFNYSWSTGDASQDLYSICGGNYSLTVTDGSTGCTAVQAAVIVDPAPISPVYNDVSTCEGSSSTFSGSVSGGVGVLVYDWSPTTDLSNPSIASPVLTASVNTSSVYTLTVSDDMGCSGTTTVNVTVNPVASVVLTTSSTTACPGSPVTMVVSGVTNFTWSDGSTNDTLVVYPLVSTSYSVVGDNGLVACADTGLVQVTVTPGFNLQFDVVDATCALDNGSATVTPLSGAVAPFTYEWSNGDTSATLDTVFAGVYTVLVKDATCSSFDTVEIISPAALAAQALITNVDCQGQAGSATLYTVGGTTPYTYTWSSGQSNDTVGGLSAGVYYYTITDFAGCTFADSVVIGTDTSSAILHVSVNYMGNAVSAANIKLYGVTDSSAYWLYEDNQVNGNTITYTGFIPDTLVVGVSLDTTVYSGAVNTYSGNTHRWESATSVISTCSSVDTLVVDVIVVNPVAGTSIIEGTVIDVTDSTLQRRPGEPVRGVDISLEQDPGGNIVMRTVTDSSGFYQFNGVPVGNYKLYVGVPGCGMIATYSVAVGAGNNLYDQRNFFVDSLEGYIDTSTTVSFALCSFVPSFASADVCLGDTAYFFDLSTGVDTSLQKYYWDFDGDGNTDSQLSGDVFVVYSGAGSFDAQLVIMANDSSCSDTTRMTINVNALPRVLATPDTIICSGGTLQLNASGALSYAWHTNAALSDTTISNPYFNTALPFTGSLIVEGTNVNGCLNRDTIDIQVLPTPDARFSYSGTVCEGTPLTFSDSSTVVDAQDVYRWDYNNDNVLDDTTKGNVVVSFAPYGIYRSELMIIAANGCRDSFSLAVTVNQNPLDVSAGPDKSVICGGTVQIPSYANQTGCTFVWEPQQFMNNPFISNPIMQPDTNMTYVVKASKNGCAAFDTINILVTPLAVDAGLDKSISCGNTVKLDGNSNGVSGTAYQWIPGDGLSSQTVLTPNATPSVTKTYVLQATKNTCYATDTVIVTVAPIPVSAGSDKSLVCGQSIQLNGSVSGVSGTSYVWQPPTGLSNASALTPTANPSETISYVLKATKGACTAYDTVVVTVDPFAVSAGPDKSIDCGSSTQLTGTAYYSTGTGVSISWYPTEGLSTVVGLKPTVNIDQTTVYYLTVKKGACESTDSVVVTVRNDIPLSFSADKTVFSYKYPPYTVKFTNTTPTPANYVFTWDFGDTTALINAVSPTHNYMFGGNFDVKLYATSQAGNCKDTLAYEDYIMAWSPVAVPSILAAEVGMELYPNPNEGKFYIELGAAWSEKTKLEMFDLTGKQMGGITMSSFTNQRAEIEIKDATAGIYFVKVSDDQYQVTKRIEVK